MNNPLLDDLPAPRPYLNDIDELNDRDPLGLSAQDIDRIIAYQRTRRAAKAAGEKVARQSTKIDLSTILGTAGLASLTNKPAAPVITPTGTPGSLRRRF